MRTSYRQAALLVVLSAFLAAGFPCAAQAAPGLKEPHTSVEWAAFFTPDPRFAEIGNIPEPMPTGKLAEAALLASGVAPERMEYYIGKLREAFEPLREKAARFSDPALRAEAILPFLHRRLFKEYQENATTVDGVIDTGYFNCVSSAVVYLLAARVLVLDMKGVQTTDHAFCVLTVPGREIDVETTSPFGYDPGTSKQFISSFTKTTRFVYVPPGDYARRRTITEKGLVSLIMHNRAVALQREGRNLEVLRLAVDRLAAFPGADSTAFLADAASNLLADLSRRGDWSGALSVAENAAGSAGSEPRIAELTRTAGHNYVVAAHNRFADLYNARDYARARTVIEEALRRLPDDPTLRKDLAALK